MSAEERLKDELFYYFEDEYENLFNDRIRVIEGNFIEAECLKSVEKEDFQTVINCAASVKHFADIDFLKKTNVEGVKNLAEMCLKNKKRLIHVSTYSVSGDSVATTPKDAVLTENSLNVGQEVESNGYVYTKYLAEQLILEMIGKDGLDAKIMRAGNLMSRQKDGEFQMNFNTNNFMRTLRAYVKVGAFPISILDQREEFSPIDETAKSIVALSGCSSSFTVFHVYNTHTVEMGNVLMAMKNNGLSLKVVSDKEFSDKLKKAICDETINEAVSPLVNYRLADDDIRSEVPVKNNFTVKALYRTGFIWSITDMDYLNKAIKLLKTLGFFD